MKKRTPGKSGLEVSALGFGPVNWNHWKSSIALCLLAASLFTSASAQENNDSSKPEQVTTLAVTKKVVNIWPGVAPGSEQWKQKETTLSSGPMQRIVNVTTPTVTAYLPDPAKATGTAVIIAPGGGFIFLGTDTHEIAEWLAARGIAGFVLKYRTAPLEGENENVVGKAGCRRKLLIRQSPLRSRSHPHEVR
jgi:Esterase/lipase